MTGDEMIEWHHRLNGHAFGWTPGFGLACYGSWGHKELDTTERLNCTILYYLVHVYLLLNIPIFFEDKNLLRSSLLLFLGIGGDLV